jgi:hypothetical protein
MNWYGNYKIKSLAQTEPPVKNPFKILIYYRGEFYLDTGVEIFALNQGEAEQKSIREYPRIKTYYNEGYDIIARFDGDKKKSIETRQKSLKDSKKQKIENAWWNKD